MVQLVGPARLNWGRNGGREPSREEDGASRMEGGREERRGGGILRLLTLALSPPCLPRALCEYSKCSAHPQRGPREGRLAGVAAELD